jgi:quaternary ammonium compound-resistance protein SugE
MMPLKPALSFDDGLMKLKGFDLSPLVAWSSLIIGGLFEVGFTTSLRFVDGFRNPGWTAVFLVAVALSMGLLELASRSIPMGTAYAIWSGIGAVGTVMVGIFWFGEFFSMVRILLIANVITAILLLKFFWQY